MLNAFTIDVEDYYHVSGFERHIDRQHWDNYESRVVANTHCVLQLLADHGVNATFFVLGWVADRFPQLIRDIQSGGHELGSHSYWHRLVYQQTPEDFRSDLLHSRRVIEDIIGEPVVAYRAPSFSITKKSLWALDILAEEGFQIDSSIFPIYHDRYGIPDANPYPHQFQTTSGHLWEFPGTVLRVAGVNLPMSGGGYFRVYPGWLKRRFLARVNEYHHQPFMFYIHPWEVDPDQPRLAAGSLIGRWRHYNNLHSTHSKLDMLLKRFRFGTMSQAIAALVAPVQSNQTVASLAI